MFVVDFYLAVNELTTDTTQKHYFFNSSIFWIDKIYRKQTRLNDLN